MRPSVPILLLLLAAGCGRSADDQKAQQFVEDQITASLLMAPTSAPVECPDIRADVAAEYVCTATLDGTPMEWVTRFTPAPADSELDAEVFATPRFRKYRDYLRITLANQLARRTDAELTDLECPADIEAVVPGQTYACRGAADGVPFHVSFTVLPMEDGEFHPNYAFDIRGAQFRRFQEQEASRMVSERVSERIEVSCFMPDIIPITPGKSYPCGLSAPARGPDRIGTGTYTLQSADGQFGFDYVLE